MASARTIAKQEKRARLEAELASRILALPACVYGVGLADPGWRFEPYSRTTGMDRAADNHFATSSLEQIRALNVRAIMAPHSVMFLWATIPMLPQALEVLAAWGFSYKSSITWRKTNADGSLYRGTGFWVICAHEILLIGTRGHPPAPAMGTQWPSVIDAPVVRGPDGRVIHSAKPKIFHELIESYFSNLPKIELYARGEARRGWDVWGAEAIQPEVEEEEVLTEVREEVPTEVVAATQSKVATMRTFIELFAGGGMAREGLGAGWRCILANDIDPKKGEAYATNYGRDRLRVCDVAALASADIPPGLIDLVWMSPPCVGFSEAGDRTGFEEKQSGSFWPSWRLIEKLIAAGRIPKVIAFENVTGLLTSRGGHRHRCNPRRVRGARLRACDAGDRR
jgi:N6-adenosine-specific RNA methylase IME4